MSVAAFPVREVSIIAKTLLLIEGKLENEKVFKEHGCEKPLSFNVKEFTLNHTSFLVLKNHVYPKIFDHNITLAITSFIKLNIYRYILLYNLFWKHLTLHLFLLLSGETKKMATKKIPLFEYENFACRKPKTVETNELSGKRKR
jgi:hypothetical protein